MDTMTFLWILHQGDGFVRANSAKIITLRRSFGRCLNSANEGTCNDEDYHQ